MPRPGHSVANDLAAVTITTEVIDLSAATADYKFSSAPHADGRTWVIDEVGFQPTTAIGTAKSGNIDVGTVADADKFINNAQVKLDLVADRTGLVSTRRNGHNQESGQEFKYVDSTAYDGQGRVVVNPGDVLNVNVVQAATCTGEGYVFIIMHPLTGYNPY